MLDENISIFTSNGISVQFHLRREIHIEVMQKSLKGSHSKELNFYHVKCISSLIVVLLR